MTYHNAYQQYQESQVMTASKGKLLLMAYDGALRFVHQAKLHMAERRYEEQNTCITKAQRLLLELMANLDRKADPELAHRLTVIYEYLFNRLIEANVSDSIEALDEVQRHLTDLRAAWAEADRMLATETSGRETSRYAAALA